MRIKSLWAAFLSMGLVYCGGGGGGGTGVDPNKTIASLTDAELMDVCERFVGFQEQPERDVDCGNGQTTTSGINPEDVADAISECVTGAPQDPCTATVGEAEACFEALEARTDDELCSGTVPTECAPLMDEACG